MSIPILFEAWPSTALAAEPSLTSGQLGALHGPAILEALRRPGQAPPPFVSVATSSCPNRFFSSVKSTINPAFENR